MRKAKRKFHGKLRWRRVEPGRHQFQDDKWAYAVVFVSDLGYWISNAVTKDAYLTLKAAKLDTERCVRKGRK
jgi:hypothetical protein